MHKIHVELLKCSNRKPTSKSKSAFGQCRLKNLKISSSRSKNNIVYKHGSEINFFNSLFLITTKTRGNSEETKKNKIRKEISLLL